MGDGGGGLGITSVVEYSFFIEVHPMKASSSPIPNDLRSVSRPQSTVDISRIDE